MIYRSRSKAAAIVVAASLAVSAATADEAPNSKSTTPSLAGIAAGIRFNDAQGNARAPSAAEREALAEAFSRDLAELTQGRSIPAGSRRASSGAVTAVVGARSLRFLTLRMDADGKPELAHADASGAPVQSNLPEE